MTVLAVLAALAIATGVGYQFGRLAGSAPASWTNRTSRIAIGQRTMNLLVLLAVRRVRRRLQAVPALRRVGALDLLWGGVARLRSG